MEFHSYAKIIWLKCKKQRDSSIYHALGKLSPKGFDPFYKLIA